MHSSPRRRQVSKRDELEFDPFVNASPCTKQINAQGPANSDILKQSLLHQLNARIGDMPDSPFRGSVSSTCQPKCDNSDGRFSDLHRNLFSSMRAISSPAATTTQAPQRRIMSEVKRRTGLVSRSPSSQRRQRAPIRTETNVTPRPEKRLVLEDALDSPAKRRRVVPTGEGSSSMSLDSTKPQTEPSPRPSVGQSATSAVISKAHIGVQGAREQKRLDMKKQAVQDRKTSKMRTPGKASVKPGWK
jgi:hypothetical protein